VILLAIDTTDARGSVAVLRDWETVATKVHGREGGEYSGWLLGAVAATLSEVRKRMEEVDVLAVSTGPGSFTGLRVGLTTVKAWAEVYGKPVVGVSRLEAMSRLLERRSGFRAAFYDAQRGQLFGGLYRALYGRMTRVCEEMVTAPGAFLEEAERETEKERKREPISWISLDPELVTGLDGWKRRLELGDTMERCEPQLAVAIGRVAEGRARQGIFTDTLELDANYVRRSDAEIFWKGR
jgi:tRNA threonylcarbamoyladenosine biosynthesis protein TsaB